MDDFEGAPPKLYEHVMRVFGQMDREATYVDGMRIYEGHTTKLFQRLGLPTPYYSSVLQRLKEMGCIEQLSRGGGSAESRWRLHKEPEFDDFVIADDAIKKGRTRLTVVEQKVADLEKRIDDLQQTGT